MWSIQHILHGDEGSSRAPSCVFTFKSRKVWQLEKQLQSVNMQWQSLLFYLLLLLLLLPTRNFLHSAATPEYIYTVITTITNSDNCKTTIVYILSVTRVCFVSVMKWLFVGNCRKNCCCSLIQHHTSTYCLVNQNTKKLVWKNTVLVIMCKCIMQLLLCWY